MVKHQGLPALSYWPDFSVLLFRQKARFTQQRHDKGMIFVMKLTLGLIIDQVCDKAVSARSCHIGVSNITSYKRVEKWVYQIERHPPGPMGMSMTVNTANRLNNMPEPVKECYSYLVDRPPSIRDSTVFSLTWISLWYCGLRQDRIKFSCPAYVLIKSKYTHTTGRINLKYWVLKTTFSVVKETTFWVIAICTKHSC